MSSTFVKGHHSAPNDGWLLGGVYVWSLTLIVESNVAEVANVLNLLTMMSSVKSTKCSELVV